MMTGLVFLTCLTGAGMQEAGAADVQRLFNGRNLDGWYTFLVERGKNNDPKGVFSVSDGVLRISGEDWGCITTEEEYEDYHLVLEFKWGSATHGVREDRARDSGLLVHSVGPDGGYGGVWMHSIECQMIEGGTGDVLVVGDGSDRFAVTARVQPREEDGPYIYSPEGDAVTIHGGRIDWFGRDPDWQDVKGFRGRDDVEHQVGEWNRLECIARGDTLTVLVNGVLVNRASCVRPSKGRIQVQSEGAEVFVRRVDLTPLAGQHYRFIYNSDGDNMYLYDDPPMTPADVHAYVDPVADAGATSFFLSPQIGMPMAYPSDVGEFIGEHASAELAAGITPDAAPKTLERSIVNLRSLIEAGHDPLGVAFDRARERGMETFISFRLNEVHAVDQKDHLILSRFWKEHPEWRIGEPGNPLPKVYLDILGPGTHPIVAGWLPGGMDFAVPEVRAHRLAQLRECCERYDADGLELDFQRFPMYFKPGEEEANIPVMTAWVEAVREMTEEVGQARGRGLMLTARVMARPEQNRAIGIDPIEWARAGLVDFVVVSHYLRNDFALPIQEYRRVLPVGFPVYGSIEVAPDADTYLRIARQLWQDGVDGIYLFNFFTTRQQDREPPFGVMPRVGDAGLAKADAPGKPLFCVANKHDDTLSFVDPVTFGVEQTIPAGPNPHEMVITPDQRFMYLSNYAPPGDTISVIDLAARKHIKQISTGEYTRIHGAAMAPDGKHAYFTAGQTGYVVEIDTAANEVTRAMETHGEISHMVLVSHDGKLLFTANINSGNVSVLDRKSGELVKQIPCGRGVEGMAFTPDRKELWALNQTGGSVTVIDADSLEPVETFPCPGMPVRVHFTSDGKRALIPSWTEQGELIVVDTAARQEVKRVPVGGFAIGIEVTPDGKRAFVGCEHGDGVHVVNLESLEVEAVIQTGEGPDPMMMWFPPMD